MIKKRISTDLFLSLAIKDAQGADVDMSAATDIEVSASPVYAVGEHDNNCKL